MPWTPTIGTTKPQTHRANYPSQALFHPPSTVTIPALATPPSSLIAHHSPLLRTTHAPEAFTEGFRRLGLGKSIGTRTWGGGIWLSFSNYLVDKGIASAGEFGSFGADGQWP
ncbi:MAG: hypothetical protein ACK51T_14025 [bacterium]